MAKEKKPKKEKEVKETKRMDMDEFISSIVDE